MAEQLLLKGGRVIDPAAAAAVVSLATGGAIFEDAA